MSDSWLGISGPAALGIAATIAFSGQGSAWVGIDAGGSDLNIVQLGVKAGPQQPGGIPASKVPHYFAAWGEGQAYHEIDLGAASSGLHRYKLWLSGDSWALAIDGHTKTRVVPLAWTPVRGMAMAESHGAVMPKVTASAVKTWDGDLWRPADLRLLGKGPATARAMREWGHDWFRVW